DPAVDTVFDGMSARSRFLRFHSPTPVLSAATRRALLDVDGRTRAAIVAELWTADGWVPVGLARLIARDPRRAEVAIAVVDHWQCHGIGRVLLQSIAALAVELGYTELCGEVLRDNLRIVKLLRSTFPLSRQTWNDGVLHISCPLDVADRAITEEDILADLMF
ncbi:MAG: GNAT family N-acetyltransferase, partial [Pseudonocardia sp.]|nr:GNAT family N-acetyltransferase [Pseudonocardia sp.]